MAWFKYYSPVDYNFDAIEKSYFFFSKVSKLNDLFDCSADLLLCTNQFSFLNEKGRNKLKKAISNYGICCFSETYDNKALWAYYANSYKGFVVEYDDQKFKCREIKWRCGLPVFCEDGEKINDSSLLMLMLRKGKVNYISRSDLPKKKEDVAFMTCASDGCDKEPKSIDIDEAMKDGKNLDKWVESLFFSKERESWQAEREYRLFAGDNAVNYLSENQKCDNGYKIYFPKTKNDIVKSFILGYNFDLCNIEHLKRFSSLYPNAKFYVIAPKEIYTLERIEINFSDLENYAKSRSIKEYIKLMKQK